MTETLDEVFEREMEQDPLVQSVTHDPAFLRADCVQKQYAEFNGFEDGIGMRTLSYDIARCISDLYFLIGRIDSVKTGVELRAKSEFSMMYVHSRSQPDPKSRTNRMPETDAKEQAHVGQRRTDKMLASMAAAKALVGARIKGLERISTSIHYSLNTLVREIVASGG